MFSYEFFVTRRHTARPTNADRLSVAFRSFYYRIEMTQHIAELFFSERNRAVLLLSKIYRTSRDTDRVTPIYS